MLDVDPCLGSVRPADFVELKLGVPYPVLIAAYYRWKAEGFFPMIFSSRPDLTLWEFLDESYKPTVEPVACCISETLVGIGWICQAREVSGGIAAEVGAAFFRGIPITIWRRSLDLLLHHAFVDRKFTEIYGVVPPTAKAGARLLTRWCGMMISEQLPWGEEVAPGSKVYSLSREEWGRRCPEGATMTYDQYRQFGFVSKLSETLVCQNPLSSKTSGNVNTANAISQSQLGVASAAGSRSAADYEQFKSLIQPLITRDTALATGNRSEALAAAMPVISKLSQGFMGAKQAIMNSMPPGAARDRALADLTTTQASTVANAQAGAVEAAPKELATAGAGVGQMSLQELGAMLSGYQGAEKSNVDAGQMGAAQQSAMLNFFKGLMGSMPNIPGMGGGNPGVGGGSGSGSPSSAYDPGMGGSFGQTLNEGGTEPPNQQGTTGPGSGGSTYEGPGSYGGYF